MRRRAGNDAGFTLIEVLIALSMLGLTMATVVALCSSGLRLREATRERLAFERDARILLASLRDDLANLVPAGPPPMVTADSIVLWRHQPASMRPALVTYQWSGAVDQDSMLVRVATTLDLDVSAADSVEAAFLRWARIFDATATGVTPLVREDDGSRFGARATLNGLTGSWTAFPQIRAVAWGLSEDPEADVEGQVARSRIEIKLSAVPRATADPIVDPAARLALMPDDARTVSAGFWLPMMVSIPSLDLTRPEPEDAS
jgi:prepilin-type N-terminal cleavage/methylation domain-containing protein